MEISELRRMANEVRKGTLTAVYHAKSGHPGGSLGACDIFTYLFFEEMHIDPKKPDDPDRDRFVLSKGHCAPGYYSALANRGFFPVKDLETLRHTGSYLQGHPDRKHIPGVDMSSGSLGQGISAAVGMALAGKMDGKNYRVYTLLGDGESEEGQVWEAAMFAGNRKLDNLCVIVDNNFHVIKIDGNDMEAIGKALAEARATKGMPTAIIAKTVKGKGVSYMENSVGWHGKAPNEEQYKVGMADLEKIGESL